MQREVEKQLVSNASTILTNLNTLNGNNGSNSGGSTTGFLEDGDPTANAQTNTIGGLSKSTFPRLQNQFASASGSLSIADMTDLYISCQINSPNGKGPDLIICSQSFFSTYKGLIQANNERYIDDSVLDAGRLSLMFNGAALHVDPFMGASVQNPSGSAPTGDAINSAYFLNTEYIKLAFDSSALGS